MNIPRLHGPALMGSAVIALLAGFLFYVFLIGIFEHTAAVISLVLFVTIAAITWTRPDSESNTKGP
jgi:predicted lipid-binding transport protein (Tim44 family)